MDYSKFVMNLISKEIRSKIEGSLGYSECSLYIRMDGTLWTLTMEVQPTESEGDEATFWIHEVKGSESRIVGRTIFDRLVSNDPVFDWLAKIVSDIVLHGMYVEQGFAPDV